MEMIRYVRCNLLCFEAISRLRVNFSKSCLYPVAIAAELEDLASNFGCKVESHFTSYLGLPLGSRYKDVSIWDQVVERFESWFLGSINICVRVVFLL